MKQEQKNNDGGVNYGNHSSTMIVQLEMSPRLHQGR